MPSVSIAGKSGSWVQGAVGILPGSNVGPVGGPPPTPVPPGDNFILKIKPSDTTRTNTTTATADPDLVIPSLAAGVYAYAMLLEAFAASNTPDIKYELLESAGIGTGISSGFEFFQSVAAIEIKQTNVFVTNNPPIIANTPTYVSVRGHIALSLASDVSVSWAQNTLDAVNGTTLRAGSWLRIEAAN